MRSPFVLPTSGFRMLRSSVAIGKYDSYKIQGYEPRVIADFVANKYRSGLGDSSFAELLTHSRAGNATMTDSDGLLKWAPHNLVIASTNVAGLGFEGSVTAAVDGFTATAQYGGVYFANTGAVAPGQQLTIEMDIYRLTGTNIIQFVTNNGISLGNVTITSVSTRLITTLTMPAGASGLMIQDRNASGFTKIFMTRISCYRSDLGGMVLNPDTGSSYVPTTSAAVYLSRRNHYVGSVNKGILIESAAATNLEFPSNDITTTVNAVATANSGISPDGTSNAVLIAATGAFAETYFLPTLADSTMYVAWRWMKKGSTDWGYIRTRDKAGTSYRTWFNLNTGVVGTKGHATAGILNSGNGWFLCYVTFASNTGGSSPLSGNGPALTDNDLATTTQTIYSYGRQTEIGHIPTSYIPTTTASVTRPAETLTIAAAKMAYSATTMSFATNGEMNYADEGTLATVRYIYWYLDANNYIQIGLNTNDSDIGVVQFFQNSVAVFDSIQQVSPGSYSPGLNVPFNLSSRNGSTFINGASNGVVLKADTTPTTLANLSATTFTLGFAFKGTISSFRQWDVDIGNLGIREASGGIIANDAYGEMGYAPTVVADFASSYFRRA